MTTLILTTLVGTEKGQAVRGVINNVISGRATRNYVALTSASSPYTVTDDDQVLVCDSTGGNITIDLPAVADSSGRVLIAKKVVAGNTVTLDGDASEEIDGSTTLALSSSMSTATIFCDGSDWWTI